MTNLKSNHYAQSQGIKILDVATQKFGPIFSIDQLEPLAFDLQIKPTQLRIVLSLLARSGWIEVLKKGTYAVKKTLYKGDISPFAVAAALVHPIAISHWSALAHHGLTTQLPSMVQASTICKVLTPEMRIGHAKSPRGRAVWRALDIEIEFIHIQSRHFFGHIEVWVNSWQQVKMTDPERTALDLIARSDVFGGIGAAFDILEEILPRINVKKMIEYGLQYDTGSVIKRLGWILDKLGVTPELIIPLQKYEVKTYYRLDTKIPSNNIYNSRWHIIENTKRINA